MERPGRSGFRPGAVFLRISSFGGNTFGGSCMQRRSVLGAGRSSGIGGCLGWNGWRSSWGE